MASVSRAVSRAILDLAEPVDQPVDQFAGVGKKGATIPDGTPINLCGSTDDIVPDWNGGWRRRGDEAIAYTYGTGTKEATK